jgi:hypothetical protein
MVENVKLLDVGVPDALCVISLIVDEDTSEADTASPPDVLEATTSLFDGALDALRFVSLIAT